MSISGYIGSITYSKRNVNIEGKPFKDVFSYNVTTNKQSMQENESNSQKHFSYSDTPSSLLDRYDNGEITREQMEEILSGKKKESLKDIADLTPEDASTTPHRMRKSGKANGDKIRLQITDCRCQMFVV